MTAAIRRIESAIQKTAKSYKGGARALGAALGANPKTFSNKCNPKEAHTLTFDEAIRVIAESDNNLILEAIAQELGYICLPIQCFPNQSDTDILQSWAAWYAELGDLSRIMATAFEDGSISIEELDIIHQQMHEEFSRELELLQRLDAHLRGETDCPLLDAIEQYKSWPDVDEALIELTSHFDGDHTRLCELLNLREGNLKRKLDPSDSDMQFNLHEIIKLMETSGNHRVLNALARAFNSVCIDTGIPTAHDTDMELLNAWSSCARERGETARLIDVALSTQKPEIEHLLDICSEMFQDFHHGHALLQRLNIIAV